jgi:hypothetical protein
MNARRSEPSAEDLATEANGLTAGLGILTLTFFPFALPGLLLALPLVLPVVALLLVAGVGYLLVRLLLLPLRLMRTALRRRERPTPSGSLPPVAGVARSRGPSSLGRAPTPGKKLA